MYMCIYIYVNIFICIYIHIHICIYVFIHSYVYIYIHTGTKPNKCLSNMANSVRNWRSEGCNFDAGWNFSNVNLSHNNTIDNHCRSGFSEITELTSEKSYQHSTKKNGCTIENDCSTLDCRNFKLKHIEKQSWLLSNRINILLPKMNIP